MPRIPLYEPSVQLTHLGPGVEQDKMSFGMENLAAAKSWEGVGQFGEKLSDIGVKLSQAIYHAKKVDDLAGMKLDTTQRLYDLRDQVMKDPDPATWTDTFKSEGEKIFQEVGQRSSDRDVQGHYKTAWASHFPVMMHGVTVEARKQQIANFAGNVEINYGKGIDLFNQAGTDVERAKIQADVFGMLQGGVSAGFLAPAKAQQLRDGFERSVTLGAANQAITDDPVGAFEKLADPAKNFPGLAAQDALALRGRAQAEVHRVQNDNYSGYMKNILGATADNPVQGAVMPTEEEILPQIGKTLNVSGAQNILAYIRGQKASQGTGQENKTDPQSYKEAATRLTDPDNPLTREEFLKNVETGTWKFDAKTYGGFLSNINSRGEKLDKGADSAIKSRIGFWKTQFGLDPKGDQVMTALGQVQAAKDAGELGKTPEEINKAVDSIFKMQHDLYMQEWSFGTKKPAQSKPGIIPRIGGLFGGPGGPGPTGEATVGGPAQPGIPGSIRNDKGWMSNDIRGSK